MNQAKFNISLNNSIDYLNKIDLFKKRGLKNIGEHSSIFKKVSRKNDHSLIYNTAIENLDWEIILKDNSILQFSFISEHNLRYAFIQNPNLYISKTDYLRCFFDDDEVLDNLDELMSEIEEHEYEQFLLEQGINSEAHIIRYDYDCSNNYSKLIHSSSHIHIGFSQSLRIPLRFIMSPLEFTFFIIRHTYIAYWKQSFINIPDFPKKIGDEKNLCSQIHKGFWDIIEENDTFLT